MPYFSIIVPVYNRPELLRWALASVARQSFLDYELIVVDDASPDPGVQEVIAQAAADNPRLKAIRRRENRGPSAARNDGLAAATGDYTTFLDSDDLYLPWTLQTFHDVIDEAGAPSVVVGTPTRVEPTDDTAHAAHARRVVRHYGDYLEYRMQEARWWFAPSGACVRTSTLRELTRFWSGRTCCEDLNLWQRLGVAPGFTRIQKPVTYGYRVHAGGAHLDHPEMYRVICRAISSERDGRYPAGRGRSRERIGVLATYGRRHALELARGGQLRSARRLFLRTLRWNLALTRWKFPLGFPRPASASLLPGRRAAQS